MDVDDKVFLAKARACLEEVARGEATIPQFEHAFLDLYSDSPKALPAQDAIALEEVFWAVENYVDDPDLREPHELDEGQLLDVVAASLAALTDSH